MNCPFCSYHETKVVDSRPTDEGQAIRRRRECLSCKKRFTTYEKVEEIPIIIIKSDGTREAFNRSKLMNGLIKSFEKRPITMSQIEEIVNKIEKNLYNSMEKEIPSTEIVELVMSVLTNLDDVASVRLPSVYRSTKDIKV